MGNLFLNKVSVEETCQMIKEGGEVILKSSALTPLQILNLRQNGVLVARQYCDELGEVGYRAFAA